MDTTNVVVKVEQEEFVVVKEETVDLTYGNEYDIPKDYSMISLDSKPLTDVAVDPKKDGLKLSDANVKSSFIVSKGIKSEVDRESPPSRKYDVKNGDEGFTNHLTHFPHPVMPSFPWPYLAHTMPWGMYPHSPSLTYPYYQLPMTPFPINNYPHIFGQVRHPNNLLSSTSLPHLDVSENLPKSALFGPLGTSEPLMYAPVQHQDPKSNQHFDIRPLLSGKVKKRLQPSSTPYKRTVSSLGQVDYSLVNAKVTENNGLYNIPERPAVTLNLASDTGFIDVDGIDDISTTKKPDFDPPRPFKCTECGRGFAKKYYFSVHMRLHTGEMSYRCSQCPNVFRQRNSLVVHQRSHSDDRPFECSLCDMRFTNKCDIKRHFVKHIPEKSGEINYISD